jgi:hypothetical protein
MGYDIPQSVSQGIDGAQDQENRRIAEIADELRRRCQLYEAELRDGENHVNHLQIEARVAEQYAKESHLWIPFSDVFELGSPGPSGNENDTYTKNDLIYKVNNLMNCGSIVNLLERTLWHNSIFYDTAYSFYGFTGFEGRTIMPILRQRLIKNARPATQVMIDTYMSALGFTKTGADGRFSNGEYEVWDVIPRNVLADKDGDLFVVDAEIRKG